MKIIKITPGGRHDLVDDPHPLVLPDGGNDIRLVAAHKRSTYLVVLTERDLAELAKHVRRTTNGEQGA